MYINDFMEQMKIAPELTNINDTARLFQEEMQRGLEGKPSSLKMLPAYTGSEFQADPGAYVITIDAGGTNLRISLIQFDEHSMPKIISIKRFLMPGVEHPVTSDAFFDFLADNLQEFLTKTTRIGFCFSYAVEILPSGDGRILELGKEVIIEGCEGKELGAELAKALKRKGYPCFTRIMVLNDTTAALISGQNLFHDQDYSNYIGFILGTGINICYYEKKARITKVPSYEGIAGSDIVNMESGYFDRQVRGELDEAFWAATLIPEDHHMEKMVSGQYLGPLLEAYLKKAASCQVFTPKAAAVIESLHDISTRNLSEYLAGGDGPNPLSVLKEFTEADAAAAFTLIDGLLERAARLVCSALLGCLRQTGSGRNPKKPVLVLMEGSTFAKFTTLRDKILYHVETAIRQENNCCLTIRQHADAVTFGTAFAALKKNQ